MTQVFGWGGDSGELCMTGFKLPDPESEYGRGD